LSIAAMLCGVSGLAFAIGVYLPLTSMMPIFVGGCMRGLVEHRFGTPSTSEVNAGVLAASGLVAGEGLAGIFVAALIALSVAPKTVPPRLGGASGEIGTLILLLFICGFLYVSARRARTKTK
jgi:hypothetical protein